MKSLQGSAQTRSAVVLRLSLRMMPERWVSTDARIGERPAGRGCTIIRSAGPKSAGRRAPIRPTPSIGREVMDLAAASTLESARGLPRPWNFPRFPHSFPDNCVICL